MRTTAGTAKTIRAFRAEVSEEQIGDRCRPIDATREEPELVSHEMRAASNSLR